MDLFQMTELKRFNKEAGEYFKARFNRPGWTIVDRERSLSIQRSPHVKITIWLDATVESAIVSIAHNNFRVAGAEELEVLETVAGDLAAVRDILLDLHIAILEKGAPSCIN